MIKISLATLGLLAISSAQIPCDDQFGAFCPEGWNVGDCLKGYQEELPAQCVAYISVMDICKSDIDEHCLGKEYSGEALSCLTDWTSPDKLTPECLAAVEASRPKPAAEKRKLTKEEQQKADKRRRVRRAAAKRAGKEF